MHAIVRYPDFEPVFPTDCDPKKGDQWMGYRYKEPVQVYAPADCVVRSVYRKPPRLRVEAWDNAHDDWLVVESSDPGYVVTLSLLYSNFGVVLDEIEVSPKALRAWSQRRFIPEGKAIGRVKDGLLFVAVFEEVAQYLSHALTDRYVLALTDAIHKDRDRMDYPHGLTPKFEPDRIMGLRYEEERSGTSP